MPNTASAEKALRQSKRRRSRNLAQTAAAKTAIKEYKRLLVSDKTEAGKILPTVYKKLDKLAKNQVIRKSKANRLKSRLAKKLG